MWCLWKLLHITLAGHTMWQTPQTYHFSHLDAKWDNSGCLLIRTREGVHNTNLWTAMNQITLIKQLGHPSYSAHDIQRRYELYYSKVVPVLNKLTATPWRRMEEWRYISIILDQGTKSEWSLSRPSRFTPGERATGWDPETIWALRRREKKISWPCRESNSGRSARRYIDCDIPAPVLQYTSDLPAVNKCNHLHF
jgi:hypothetical protein